MKFHRFNSPKESLDPLPCRRSAAASARQRQKQHGVALVITLILLAVITTLAIAFVALTHRETAVGSVSRSTTDAEMAAEGGYARAIAEIQSRFIADNQGNNNGSQILGPGLMVSLSLDSDRLNPAGAYRDPSPPVFINTNPLGNGPLEDRYFLDLNRNHYFDETGLLPMTTDLLDPATGRYQPVADPKTGLHATNWVVGDPMWIGLTQNPRRWHTNDNRYISRYAWIVLPVGISLDVNTIHNNAELGVGTGYAYLRNQGVGTFELNLSGFFTDLNTNEWGNYQYNEPRGLRTGPPFDDAMNFLKFRNFGSARQTMDQIYFPSVLGVDIKNSLVDLYANGPLTTNGILVPLINDTTRPWFGSANNTNFYSVHDFLSGRTAGFIGSFQNRMLEASTNGNSYDRYTFYRMLSQLGTDTARHDRRKINLNFNDVDYRPEDLVPWTNYPNQASAFFRRVASRILGDEFNIRLLGKGIGGIPVFTNNVMYSIDGPLYSSRIHQVLQLVANIYDASHGSKYREAFPYYPTIFRPVFDKRGDDIYIVDYVEEEGIDLITRPWRMLEVPKDRAELADNDNIYGVPPIVGARKGFPNFNEFVLETRAQLTRKLEFVKSSSTDRNPRMNHLFFMGISNTFGLEAWFPYGYTNAYQRNVGIRIVDFMTTTLTNDANFRMANTLSWMFVTNVAQNTWISNSFYAPPLSNHITLLDSVLRGSGASAKFLPVSDTDIYEQAPPPTNRWGLTVTNRLQFYMIERDPSGKDHLIDIVGLSGMDVHFDISKILNDPIQNGAPIANTFSTLNPYGMQGVTNQIQVSLGNTGFSDDWADYGRLTVGNDRNLSVAQFRLFFGLDPRFYPSNSIPAPSNSIQAPFTATRRLYQTTSWSANDPLVHHRIYDLRDTTNSPTVGILNKRTDQPNPPITSMISNINTRYKPWGGRYGSSTDGTDYNSGTRDPLMFSPDYWDFPTNQFANPGWLGRVHRGTPWQTVYFKSSGVSEDDWKKQGGASAWFKPLQTHPTNDWRLADMFTAEFHPNTTRGQLAINQTNLAAWSALLSGVLVSKVTNASGRLTVVPDMIKPSFIDPNPPTTDSAVSNVLFGVVSKINTLPGRQFHHLSDILSVPEFTDASPYMTPPRVSQADYGLKASYSYPASDADYERLPQQVLGLMRLGEPRFVIYSWGQSLKPAEFGVTLSGKDVLARGPSVETAGAQRGLVRNYQITGEVATRTVVRVEFEADANNPSQLDYRRPRIVVESFNVIPPD